MHGTNNTALGISNPIEVYETISVGSEHKSENEAYKDEPQSHFYENHADHTREAKRFSISHRGFVYASRGRMSAIFSGQYNVEQED